MKNISVGDIVSFKRVHKIDLNDLIARKKYSKYMIVIQVLKGVKPHAACKVMCANGEINWVSVERIELSK